MKAGNRSNALLVELLIVVAFFMLSATMLMQLFSAARKQGDQAQVLTRALINAQNLAEQLYAAPDPQQELEDLGFTMENGIWRLADSDFITEVESLDEVQVQGVIHRQQVRILQGEEELVSLPVARYDETGIDAVSAGEAVADMEYPEDAEVRP